MTSKPHTAAFAAEHAKYLEAETPKKAVDTPETLIERFTGTAHKSNPDFTMLAAKTQKDHLYSFKLIRKEWPVCPWR